MSFFDLISHGKKLGVVGASLMNKQALIKRINELQEDPDQEIKVEGVLEKLPDGNRNWHLKSKFQYLV